MDLERIVNQLFMDGRWFEAWEIDRMIGDLDNDSLDSSILHSKSPWFSDITTPLIL